MLQGLVLVLKVIGEAGVLCLDFSISLAKLLNLIEQGLVHGVLDWLEAELDSLSIASAQLARSIDDLRVLLR